MLTGQGPFADAQMRLGFIPQVLQLSQQLALQAILSVQESGLPTAFTHIKQGQNEQFTQFIDRLYKVIETHPDLTGDMKTKMFQLLAFDNANERNKQILGSLPRSAQVADMVELMERTQQTKYAARVAAAVQGAIAPLLHKNRERRNSEK